MMSVSPPRFMLVRLQLRNPAAWAMSLMLATSIAADPTYMGVASIPMLLLTMPWLVSRRRSDFEQTLPLNTALILQTRFLAALAVALPPMLVAVYLSARRLYDAPSVIVTLAACACVTLLLLLLYSSWLSDRVASISAVASSDAAYSRSDVSTDSSRSHSLWQPLLRSLVSVPTAGMLVCGLITGYVMTDFLAFYFFTHFTVFTGFFARRRFAWLHALPIPLPRISHLGLVPVLLLGGLGYVLGDAYANRSLHARLSMTKDAPYEEDEAFDLRTKVSVRYWQPLRNDAPRLIAAPWGETSAADTIRVLGVTLHNLYSVDTTSSAAFLEWQFKRASLAVYGQGLSLAEYESLDRKARPLPILQTLPVRIVRIGLCLMLVISTLWAFQLMQSQRAQGSRPLYLSLFVAGGLIAVSPLLFALFSQIRWGTTILSEALDALLLRLYPTFPQSTLALGLLAVIPALLSYALLQRQFAKAG